MPKPSKILIVDDDREMCNLLSQTLSTLGYETTHAHDGLQALDQIKKGQFNIVLLDLMLPGPGGIETLKRIREQQTGLEVIILTAHSSLETAIEALRLGAYDYLTKPFSISAVRSAVKRATEKQHLEAKLASIYNLSCKMALAQNVEQAVQAVLSTTAGVLEFESCGVWLVDEARNEVHRYAAYGPEQEAPLRLSLSDDKGIAVAVVHGGEPLYVPKVRDDPRCVAVRASTQSELAVPLKVTGRVIGVLNIESAELDGFDESDLKLLSTLAAQGATAIENARLHEQAQQEIAERKRAELALRQERDRVKEYLDIAGAIIVVLDNQGGITLINRRGCKTLGYREEELLGENWFDACLPEQNRKETKGVFDKLMAGEIEPVEYYENSILTRSGEERLIAWHNTALRDETGKITGTLSSGEDITERKQKEERIAQRNIQLTALNEINKTINSTLELQETLTLIADHSIRLLDVEATSVLLYDETNDDLWFAAASGSGAHLVLGQRLALGQGVAGWVAQHNEAALVPDASQDPRVSRNFDREGLFTTRSIVCVPLHSQDQITGVLEAVNKREGAFNQEDLRLLSLLAVPVVTAIENARLFEKVRTAREQLQALSRRLVEVQEEERGRVARELHDETGQALSSLLLGLSILEEKADDPVAVITRANELEGLVDRTLENLHRLSMNLRPASLDHLGLVPALEHYVELFSHQHGITAQFEAVELEEKRLPSAIETALYRIVQEALTNVLRHARATRVDVLLELRGDQIVTIVEDDGVGFDPASATKGNRLGLLGMRERAEMLNGTLTIESSASTGTTVLVEIPGVMRNP